MARPTKKEVWKRNIAYGVTKMTNEVLAKFDQAFAIGATIGEACDYADVDPSTLWRWQKKNPELSKRFERMRERLPLKAKQNIANSIHGGDTGFSKWLVERQQPEKYGETVKVEHSGQIDSDVVHIEDENLRKELKDRLRENLQKRWQEKKNV